MNESIPNGWIIGKLYDLLLSIKTGISEYPGEKCYYSTGSINGAEYIPEGSFTYINRPSRANRIALIHDVMQARMKETNKGIIIDEKLNNQLFSTGFIQLRTYNNTYDSKLLFYYIISHTFLSQRDELTTGSTQEALTDTKAKDLFFPLPPINEQKRIVARLDQIIPRINALLTRLDKIPSTIKRFRQSVLTAAVTGKLTESWRKKHLDIENAKVLLERIIKKRMEIYNIECEIAKKKNEKKPQKRFCMSNPEKFKTKNEDLPSTWETTKIGFLSWVTKLAGFEYTKYIKFFETGEIPVIRAQNVQMGKFVEDNILFIDKKTSDFLERSRLYGGEILMVFIGAGTGNVCLCPSDKRWHLAPNVAKIVVDEILNLYLLYFLQSPLGNASTLSFIKATAQPSLSMETIRQITINLPPLEEQIEIVRQVEKLFTITDKLEAHYQQAKVRVDKLSQSVLSKAFRGELVITEVELAEKEGREFESAEKLLARIVEEKKKLAYTTNKTKKERKVGN